MAAEAADTGVTGQATAGQTGVEGQEAAGDSKVIEGQTGETTQAAAETTIPKERLDAEIAKTKAERSENDSLKAQIAVMAANQAQVGQTQTQQQQTQATSLTQAVVKELGFADEPYLTTEMSIAVTDRVQQYRDVQIAATTASANFISSHADYSEVVGQTDPLTNQFVTAPPLTRILAKNPQLAAAIKSSAYPEQLAYEIASKESEYVTSKQAAVETKASKAVAKTLQNEGQMSISAAQSGGGTLSKAADVQAWTQADVRANVLKAQAAAT